MRLDISLALDGWKDQDSYDLTTLIEEAMPNISSNIPKIKESRTRNSISFYPDAPLELCADSSPLPQTSPIV
jgi:hypothetical protein